VNETDAADPATRIAMWSGPRTVSTALMRSWENRPDTVVTNEPLYAFYLDRTGLDHPGRDAVIASQSTDWRVVLAQLANGPLAWPAGPRDSDGVWAPWWYDSVRSSTGFAPYRPAPGPLPARLEPLAGQCQPYFARLHRYRLVRS